MPASDDFLTGLDIPSSSSSEEVDEAYRPSRKIGVVPVTSKLKKNDKERKTAEKAHALKSMALRPDHDTFDVSFEGQQREDGYYLESAVDVKCRNLTVRAKGNVLLENTALTISAHRRYGLVGPNGQGKSTLLRLLARRENCPCRET